MAKNLREYLELVEELDRARALGDLEEVALIEEELGDAGISSRFNLPGLNARETEQVRAAIREAERTPPILSLRGDEIKRAFSTLSARGVRATIDELSDSEISLLTTESLRDQGTGLDVSLLDVLSDTQLLTDFGIIVFDPVEETAEGILQGDFFTDPGALVDFGSQVEERAVELLTEADLNVNTRSNLMFSYKYFQANPDMQPREAITSEDFQNRLDDYLAFMVDFARSRQSINSPEMQDRLREVEDPLVREVIGITTDERWIAGKVPEIGGLAPVNEVSQSEFSRWTGIVANELDLGSDTGEHEDFAWSKINDFTARYQSSGSNQSFIDWATENIIPKLHLEMIDERAVDINNRDEIIDPVIDDMVRGMPFAYATAARNMLKSVLADMSADSGLAKKSEVLQRMFPSRARADWLRTFIATEVVGTHPNGDLIVTAAEAAGLDLLSVFRSMLNQDFSAEFPGAESIGFNTNRQDTRDTFLAILGSLSPGVQDAISQPATSDDAIRERIQVFDAALDPLIDALGIPFVFRRQVKDEYERLVIPDAATRQEALQAVNQISKNDFEEFARQFVIDIVEREFDNGDVIADTIEEKFGGNPFAFFSENGLDSFNIRTKGSLNRLTQDKITLPDSVQLQVIKRIQRDAPFVAQLPDFIEGPIQDRLAQRIQDLAAQRGQTVEDFLKDANVTGELRQTAEIALNESFSDDIFQALVAVNAGGSVLDFLVQNSVRFEALTRDQIIERARDFTLNAPVAGEPDEVAQARSDFTELSERETQRERTQELEDENRLRRAEEEARTAERDIALEEERRILAEREAFVVRPFQEAFEKQAGRFLFGPSGRQVLADVGPEALRMFEAAGEPPAGDVGRAAIPISQEGVAQDFVQREFGAQFFTEAARRSRASREPTPARPVARQGVLQPFRIGAEGGR